MKASNTALFEALKAAGPSKADALQRITLLTRLLDSAFLIPGLNRRVGLDAIIGLVPGIGDAVSTLLASYIIWEARQLGLDRKSTRLNSSHANISYAVFCLKKKNTETKLPPYPVGALAL